MQLYELEEGHGTLLRGVLAGRKQKNQPPPRDADLPPKLKVRAPTVLVTKILLTQNAPIGYPIEAGIPLFCLSLPVTSLAQSAPSRAA